MEENQGQVTGARETAAMKPFKRTAGLALLFSHGGARGFVLVAILMAPQIDARDTDSKIEFNIPAEPLGAALTSVALQANLQIFFEQSLTEGFTSPPVAGSMTASDALTKLLTGTHLQFTRNADGALMIGAGTTAPSSFGSLPIPDSTLANAAKATSTPAFAGALVFSEIQVVSQYENGYNATRTIGATRLDTDLMDIPGAVSVITRKLLDDQQIQNLADAVAGASGVQINSSQVVIGNTFVFRGFSQFTGGVLENGLAATNAGYSSTTPIWGLDSVEVLKGPEAILSGANSSFGGVINLVTKQPQVTPIQAVSFTYGSYGVANVGWDSAGPLTDDKDIAYRMVAQITRSGGDAAGHDGDHDGYYLAPSLRWKTHDTSLLVGVESSVVSCR